MQLQKYCPNVVLITKNTLTNSDFYKNKNVTSLKLAIVLCFSLLKRLRIQMKIKSYQLPTVNTK